MKVHDPYGEMKFPHGVMLEVLRGGGVDEFGDKQPHTTSHMIGKCAIKHTEETINVDGAGPRNRARYQVTAPPDSDIAESDRVKLPNGFIGEVTTAPVRPVNPFTGWAPFVRFTLTSD